MPRMVVAVVIGLIVFEVMAALFQAVAGFFLSGVVPGRESLMPVIEEGATGDPPPLPRLRPALPNRSR